MKVEIERPRKFSKSGDVVRGNDQFKGEQPVLFEPAEVLKDSDFESMVQGKEASNLAMDLAVASIFFPERMSDQTSELVKITEVLSGNKTYVGTVLGHPEASISNEGRLVLRKKPKLKGRTQLPERPGV